MPRRAIAHHPAQGTLMDAATVVFIISIAIRSSAAVLFATVGEIFADGAES